MFIKILSLIIGLGSVPFTMDLTEKQYLEMLKEMKEGVEIVEKDAYFKTINDPEAKQYLSKRPSAEQIQHFFYVSLSLGRQFRETQTISQLQKQQEFVDLIHYVKGHLEEIEKNRILLIESDNEDSNQNSPVEEEDYEIVNQAEAVYGKAKEEWEPILIKAEQRLADLRLIANGEEFELIDDIMYE